MLFVHFLFMTVALTIEMTALFDLLPHFPLLIEIQKILLEPDKFAEQLLILFKHFLASVQFVDSFDNFWFKSDFLQLETFLQ